MADSKPDRSPFPGAAPATTEGNIDRFGSWSGQSPASVELRRSQSAKSEEPVASRHGTLTRSFTALPLQQQQQHALQQ